MIRRVSFLFLAVVASSAWVGSRPALAAPAQPQMYGQQGGWDIPPREFNEVQRRGFRDGIEGARKDFGNHRNPDVNNRDEFRDPDDIPHRLRRAYREAFRRGYAVAASHLWGGAPMAQPPQANWDWGMRGLRSDAQRRGYNEGVEEARNDFNSRRRPDPDDHQEFRYPPVPPPLAEEYREGFMRGYEVAMSQLSGEGQWQFNGNPDQWQAPHRFTEMQRRGFHDGLVGAQRDFGNHRMPNPANRDEYRSPHLPPQFWPEYREGFRRGYEMAAARLWGGQ